MRLTDEEKYWVWLSGVEGMGAATFYNILGSFIDARTACENYREIPQKLKLQEKLRENLLRDMNTAYLEKLLTSIEKSGQNVLTRLNQDYPKNLAEIDNPPPVLYFKGTLPDMDIMSCGMVGTRKPTKDGFDIAKTMGHDLAAQGVVVVSGMARGIDTASHTGAMAAGGKTVAVLGCGADVLYPPENRKVYDQIVEHGAIVSEFIPGTIPAMCNFPMRNRIISGMSHVLIAGEGGKKSGARITVDCALRQGKDVYALPCNLGSTVAALPVYLIESGAPIAQNAYDLMADQGWVVQQPQNDTAKQSRLPKDQQLVYAILSRESATADELCAQTSVGIKEMNMLLTVMELGGEIEATAGGLFRINK